jgi:DNA-binding transcriptional LysR family regulator
LHAFTVFAEHRNFTRAAEELHISQPALHVKIKKLGAVLGIELYQRDGRELHLTAAGRKVAAFAVEFDESLRGFINTLHEPDEAAPVVLAAGDGAHLYVLANGIRRLLERGTNVRLLTTNTDETVDAVRYGRADLGVAVIVGRPMGVAVRDLSSYEQVLVLPAGHPLARKRRVALSDLEAASLVLPPPSRPHRAALDRALRRAGVDYSVGVEAEGWPQMMRFVSLGVGLAIVNGCVTAPDGLVARPVIDLPSITYSVIQRKEAMSDDVRAVLEMLESSVP